MSMNYCFYAFACLPVFPGTTPGTLVGTYLCTISTYPCTIDPPVVGVPGYRHPYGYD